MGGFESVHNHIPGDQNTFFNAGLFVVSKSAIQEGSKNKRPTANSAHEIKDSFFDSLQDLLKDLYPMVAIICGHVRK